MQILVFRLKDNYYGITTDHVVEITKTHDYKPIPKSPEWVEGLINLRGEVLTLVNLYSLLKIDDFTIEDCYNNTIIVKRNQQSIAVMVDEVIGVSDIQEEQLQPTSEQEDSFVQSLVTVYDRIVNIIELNSLFEEKEG